MCCTLLAYWSSLYAMNVYLLEKIEEERESEREREKKNRKRERVSVRAIASNKIISLHFCLHKERKHTQTHTHSIHFNNRNYNNFRMVIE